MDDSKRRQAIDACRSQFDDLNNPEQRGLADDLQANPAWKQHYERSRRFDNQVADMMQEVPVPIDLAQRLLATARANETAKAEPLANTVANVLARLDDTPATANTAPEPASPSRRRWFVRALQGTAAIAMLAVLTAGIAWLRTPPALTRESLSLQALGWVNTLPNHWQSPAAAVPTKGHPPGAVIAVSPRGWQRFSTLQDRQAVAYDLTQKQGRATLFVLQTLASSPFSATPTRLPSTGGWGICAWKEGDVLYVLVADESRLRIEKLIHPPRTVAQSNFSKARLL